MPIIDLTTKGGKGRKCGQCTACCTTHEIPQLDKGEYEDCRFCTDKCSIYPTRPKTCKGYTCAWLQGLFSDGMRPDLCGVVVEMQLTKLGKTWVLREYEPGVFDVERLYQRVHVLFDYFYKSGYPVVILRRNGKRILLADKEMMRTVDHWDLRDKVDLN